MRERERERERESDSELRGHQHAEYLQVSQDYAKSMSASKRAIEAQSSQEYDRSQAEMLLQRILSEKNQ